MCVSCMFFFFPRSMILFSAPAKLLWSPVPCSWWRPAPGHRPICPSAMWKRFWRQWLAAWLWPLWSRPTATPQDAKISPPSGPSGRACWGKPRKRRSALPSLELCLRNVYSWLKRSAVTGCFIIDAMILIKMIVWYWSGPALNARIFNGWKGARSTHRWSGKRGETWYVLQVLQRGLSDMNFYRSEVRESSLPLPAPTRPRATATDIYQRARSWKVDDVGNAGVFDNVELGTEADVFLRAPLILCPHAPFWSPAQLSEQLMPPPTPPPTPFPHPSPLFPATSLLPFRRLGLQPMLRVSNRGAGLPWQPFSSHCNLPNLGNRAWGSKAGAHLQHVALWQTVLKTRRKG